MRIVSWNMGCGGRQSKYRRSHEEAWRYLLHELRPDVALLQETLSSARAWIEDRGRLVMSADANGDNGAAVFARAGYGVAPLELRSTDAFLAAADVSLARGGRGGGEAVRAISVHLYPRSGAQHRANLMDLVDAVTVAAAEDDRAFVIGGDLNASRGFDAVYGGKRYATFFADVTKRGFHDCLFALHGAESQSFWGPAAKHAYQLDHVFVDARSGKSVKTARVIDTPETRRLSDHGPVVIDLTDGASAA